MMEVGERPYESPEGVEFFVNEDIDMSREPNCLVSKHSVTMNIALYHWLLDDFIAWGEMLMGDCLKGDAV